MLTTNSKVLKLLSKANKILKSFGPGCYLNMTKQRFTSTLVSLGEQMLFISLAVSGKGKRCSENGMSKEWCLKQ